MASPLKAIKKYCKEQCCVGDTLSWRDCSVKDCILYPFRFGVKPSSKKALKHKKQQQNGKNT